MLCYLYKDADLHALLAEHFRPASLLEMLFPFGAHERTML